MLPELPADARVLIVDDLEANLRLLSLILARGGGPSVKAVSDPRQALPLAISWQPDLVLLDLHMPEVSGFDVLQQLREQADILPFLPVIVLTADITAAAKERALALGAKDFLSKPFNATEVLLRARNLIETRRLHLQQGRQNEVLEERVQARTRDLEEAQCEILDRLALAADFRDDVTGQHTRRVGTLSGVIGKTMGLAAPEVEVLRLAAPLHDIGKLGVPDGILLKPGKLGPEEFEQMKAHVRIGDQMLAGSRFPVLQAAQEIALTHHERWDGQGYLLGLAGEEIPLASRIVSVADVFDALTHERPYKQAWPPEEALAELLRLTGAAFDPRVVEAFASLRPEAWDAAALARLAEPPAALKAGPEPLRRAA